MIEYEYFFIHSIKTCCSSFTNTHSRKRTFLRNTSSFTFTFNFPPTGGLAEHSVANCAQERCYLLLQSCQTIVLVMNTVRSGDLKNSTLPFLFLLPFDFDCRDELVWLLLYFHSSFVKSEPGALGQLFVSTLLLNFIFLFLSFILL